MYQDLLKEDSPVVAKRVLAITLIKPGLKPNQQIFALR